MFKAVTSGNTILRIAAVLLTAIAVPPTGSVALLAVTLYKIDNEPRKETLEDKVATSAVSAVA